MISAFFPKEASSVKVANWSQILSNSMSTLVSLFANDVKILVSKLVNHWSTITLLFFSISSLKILLTFKVKSPNNFCSALHFLKKGNWNQSTMNSDFFYIISFSPKRTSDFHVVKNLDHWTPAVSIWWLGAQCNCGKFNFINWKCCRIQDSHDWLLYPNCNYRDQIYLFFV